YSSIEEGAGVFHDREFESGMSLRLFLQQDRSGTGDTCVGTEPIDDGTLNPAADHVLHLPVNLRRDVSTITHVHGIVPAKARQPVHKNPGGGPGIKQLPHRSLAHVAGGGISVALG